MKKRKKWSQLDHAERLERIEALWNTGMSDSDIAAELSASKGQIVGYRHKHLPGVTAATRGQASATTTTKPPEELRMQSSKSPRLIPNEPGRASSGYAGKLTSDWHKQCGHTDEDRRQCGYHFTVQRGREKRCDLHAHELS